jgi:transcriptional regulator with XRE-family HTH domain
MGEVSEGGTLPAKGGAAMTDAQPNLHRRRLGLQLKSLRRATGMSLEEAAEKLDLAGKPALSRIENGKQRVQPTAIFGFFEVYGLEDEGRRQYIRQLAKLAASGKRSNLINEYRSAITDPFAEYLDLEELATKVETFAALVPGLLQTERYARAVVAGSRSWHAQREIDNFVDLRMARQKALRRTEPLGLWCIIEETALVRRVGGNAVMKEQLQHLLNVTEELSYVQVQVLLFDHGAHTGMDGRFHLLHFPAGPPVAVVEPMTTSLYLEEDEHLARYETTFNHLRTEALDVRASRSYINRVIKERYT